MFDELNSDAGPNAQAAYLGENISLLLHSCHSTTLLAYPGLAFGAGILHLPMILQQKLTKHK